MSGRWLGHLAWAEFIAGEPEVARQRLDDFIASTDPARTSMAIPFAMRAVIAREDGDHELALSLAQQAIAVAPADPFGGDTVHTCLLVFAATQADQGQHEVAVARGRRGSAQAARLAFRGR